MSCQSLPPAASPRWRYWIHLLTRSRHESIARPLTFVTGVICLATLLAYGSRWSWGCDLLVNFRTHYILVLCLALLIAVALRRWPLAAAAVSRDRAQRVADVRRVLRVRDATGVECARRARGRVQREHRKRQPACRRRVSRVPGGRRRGAGGVVSRECGRLAALLAANAAPIPGRAAMASGV